MACLWVVLFFGGAILSPATGVCINAVPPRLRSFGSAIAMFLYNLLGYAAAPLVGGYGGESLREQGAPPSGPVGW